MADVQSLEEKGYLSDVELRGHKSHDRKAGAADHQLSPVGQRGLGERRETQLFAALFGMPPQIMSWIAVTSKFGGPRPPAAGKLPGAV